MITFLTFLFYLFTILPIMWELNAFDEAEDVSKMYATTKEPTWKEEHGWVVPIMFSYIVWNIAGLFTSQWPLFILLMLLSFLPIKDTVRGIKIDAALTLVVLVAIILNKIHFKVDLWEWIKSLL